ncbi:MAG: hypothetical protein U0M42_03015 [Acutalibacteraceae bacterium]|nr:hypothetical protein [Acutalibacteraceae bacterium]
MKKLLCLVLCAVLSLFFVGCTSFESGTDSLLAAPKLTGEMQPVQQALEAKIGGKYQLKFPSSGETKSAITLIDITGDGLSEAVAFYSTSSDNAVIMNIAVIQCVDGFWQVTSQESINAVGVESVHFVDLDSDKSNEIVVGWSVYGTASKTVSVYEYSADTLIKLVEEAYTAFTICDLDGNLSQDLLLFQLDLTSSRAFARCFSFNSQGVSELGNCEIDGNVTSYNQPVLTTLPTGEFCVFVDCIKGAGMITEVIYFANNKMVSPLYDATLMENTVTYRPAIVPCRDYDGDGFMEIPVMYELPTNAGVSAANLTVWNGFDGQSLVAESYALMNYSDGYSIKLNEQLAFSTTTHRNLENRERIIYEYDYETGQTSAELFRIRVVSKSAYDSGMYAEGYAKLAETESLVWLCTVSEKAELYGITKDNIGDIFELITEG